MTPESREVRAEFLLPHEIDTALAARSVVYLPLGTIEYHGAHLPIGVDGLTAHGICTRAAERAGGIVLPALFYGTGGGHSAYPWTIMAQSAAPIAELVDTSLRRLSEFGVAAAVLFSGHFPNEQLELVDGAARRWNAAGRPMRVIALSVNRAGARIEPDHAGLFETSLLSALWPDRVQLRHLPSGPAGPGNDGDDQGRYRHDPDHRLYGIFGPDPRAFDPAVAVDLLEDIVTWTLDQVQARSKSAATG